MMRGKILPDSKIDSTVAVIGLGYVGLPLAISVAEKGYKVIGVDSDQSKVSSINDSKIVFSQVSDNQQNTHIMNQKFKATTNFEEVSCASIIVICVPTPLTRDRQPDLSFLNLAAKSVGEHLQPGSLIILESTVAPGFTRNSFLPTILKASGLQESEIDLAFSPERVDPGNLTWNVSNTPRIVSGLHKKSLDRAVSFYSKVVSVVHKCESLEIAETAKLLENSFRLINISFINELMVFCNKFQIDINSVIRAASTKPFGFMPFYPSLGAGGHCIPIDPIYLLEKSKELSAVLSMIELADKINQKVPSNFVDRAEQKIGNLFGKKILIIGVAYKPNVNDARETPARVLIDELIKKGAVVKWHDDLIGQWGNTYSAKLDDTYDLAIVATPHDYLDLSELKNVPIIKTWESIE